MNGSSRHLEPLGSRSRPTWAGVPARADAGIRSAREYCIGVLRQAGFETSERPFEYSAFAGSLGAPVAGVIIGLTAIVLYLSRGETALTLGALVALLACLGVLGHAGREGVIHFPVMRRRGLNLEAVRGADHAPALWLVAHLDSKWQPVSMYARVAGVIGSAAGIAALAVLALAQGPRGPGRIDVVGATVLMLTWLASAPLVLSIVGDRNHGTLDNASGVAAVLEAAESLPLEANVGVLITDAEELALAGARVWVREWSPERGKRVALNCDSVDDHGPLVLMYTRKAPGRLIEAVTRAARAGGETLSPRILRLLPGILTDSVALADAGWETLTLSRGTLRTLKRIHTSRDTLQTMRGTGIAGAARALAGAARELC